MTVYAVIFVPVPSQDLGLQRHVMSWYFNNYSKFKTPRFFNNFKYSQTCL